MSELTKMSKEEISDRLNQLLGTDSIDFTKLTKNDLVELHEVLSRLLKPIFEMSLREILDDIFGNRSVRQRVIFPRARRRLRQLLRGAEEEEKKET